MPPIAPHVPTANPRRSAGKTGRSSASDDGASSAAASACAVRPATRSPTVGAAAQTADATPNSARPDQEHAAAAPQVGEPPGGHEQRRERDVVGREDPRQVGGRALRELRGDRRERDVDDRDVEEGQERRERRHRQYQTGTLSSHKQRSLETLGFDWQPTLDSRRGVEGPGQPTMLGGAGRGGRRRRLDRAGAARPVQRRPPLRRPRRPPRHRPQRTHPQARRARRRGDHRARALPRTGVAGAPRVPAHPRGPRPAPGAPGDAGLGRRPPRRARRAAGADRAPRVRRAHPRRAALRRGPRRRPPRPPALGAQRRVALIAAG